MTQRASVQYVRFYTHGTAARKLEYAVPEKKQMTALPKPKKVKRRKIYVDPVAILGVVVAVCMLIVMTVGIKQLQQAQHDAVVMELYVEQLTQENEILTAEYAGSYDIEMVEQTARSLGMVPRENVPHSTIEVTPAIEIVEEPTVWENIGTLLTNLFA